MGVSVSIKADKKQPKKNFCFRELNIYFFNIISACSNALQRISFCRWPHIICVGDWLVWLSSKGRVSARTNSSALSIALPFLRANMPTNQSMHNQLLVVHNKLHRWSPTQQASYGNAFLLIVNNALRSHSNNWGFSLGYSMHKYLLNEI